MITQRDGAIKLPIYITIVMAWLISHVQSQCATTVTWVMTAQSIEKLDSRYLLRSIDDPSITNKDQCITACNAQAGCVGVQFATDGQNICQLMSSNPPASYEIMQWNDNMLYDMYEKVCGSAQLTRTVCNMTSLPTQTLASCTIGSQGCTQLADIHTVTDIRGCEHWCRVGYQSFMGPGDCKAYVIYYRLVAFQKVLRCRLYGETSAIIDKPAGSEDQAYARTCYTITPPKIPTPCYYTEWAAQGACSKSCGGGTQTWTRTRVPAETGGADCPDNNLPTSKTGTCNPAGCPTNCVLGAWSNVGSCSVTCGGGQVLQQRTITQPTNGGLACTETNTQRFNECGLTNCPTNCFIGDWQSSSSCSSTCGGGTLQQFRVVTEATNGGTACPANTATTQPCNTQACPVNCQIGAWTNQGTCTKSCGGGTQVQTRTVIQAQNGGTPCPAGTIDQQTINCNTQVCPTNCQIGAWTATTACTRTCGGGTRTETRTVVEATNGGTPCPAGTLSTQTVNCNPQGCPSNCAIGLWVNQGGCSKSCGGGLQTQTRTVTQAQNGGTACPAGTVTTQTIDCNTGVCPLDCVISAWTLFGTCSATCGTGVQQRRRTVTQPANGGAACPPDASVTSDTISCNVQACPVNCVIGAWSNSGTCSRTCGGGLQTQIRTVQQAQNGGTPCPAGTISTQEISCNTQQCPTDCTFNQWADSTPCSITCGQGGSKTQTRTKNPEQNGGAPCPTEPLTRQMVCNTGVGCPVNCVVSAWVDSACSVTCGGGSYTQTRTIITAASNGGTPCPTDLARTQPCNSVACPVNCVIGNWQNVGVCSKTCGTGQLRQQRTLTPPLNGGTACPTGAAGATERFLPCNEFNCPIDCQVGDWVNSGACSKPCGGGLQTQTRAITQAQFNGVACDPGLQSTRQLSCNTQGCAQNCEIGAWQNVGSCSASCGSGQQRQTRVVVQAQNGGQACPANTVSEQYITCGTGACPTPCFIGQWVDQTSCSVTCGSGGTKTQIRQVTQASNGGTACPAGTVSTQTVPCQGSSCPINCVFGPWTNQGTCSTTCGNGIQLQVRTKIEASFGGLDCVGDLRTQRTVTCNVALCPTHCSMSAWIDSSSCSTTCGIGSKTQTRVMTMATNGGIPCADTSVTRNVECLVANCPPTTELRKYMYMEGNVTESSKYSFTAYADFKTQNYSRNQCEILCDTQMATCNGILYSNETWSCILLSNPGTLQLYPDASYQYWIPEQNIDPDGATLVDSCTFSNVVGFHGDPWGVQSGGMHKIIAGYSSQYCELMCRLNHIPDDQARRQRRCTAFAFGYLTSYFHPLNTVCYLFDQYSSVGTATGNPVAGKYWLYTQNCKYIN